MSELMTDTQPFAYLRRVEFADTDMAGIVHFARLFCYLEEAEHAFLRSVGLSVHQKMQAATISWPRVSASCDFKSPLRLGDTAAVSVRVGEIKRKTVTYLFDVRVGERDVATGCFIVVCCEVGADGIHSVEIPGPIRATLEPHLRPDADDFEEE